MRSNYLIPAYRVGKLAERVYAQKDGSEGGKSQASDDDGVIDADFEEVKK